MKILLQNFLLFVLISCGQGHVKPELYGAWQTVIEPKNLHGITDSLVFEKPDSLKLYYIENGKIVESLFGKFFIDEKNKKLMTQYDTVKFRFDIVQLENNSLQIRQSGKHSILKFRRLNN